MLDLTPQDETQIAGFVGVASLPSGFKTAMKIPTLRRDKELLAAQVELMLLMIKKSMESH